MSEKNSCFVVLPDEMELPAELRCYFEDRALNINSAVLYLKKDSLENTSASLDNQLQLYGYTRIFECYWIPSQISDDVRTALIQALFSLVASRYESILVSGRNYSCYKHLYSLAINCLQCRPNRVLDFGCGTGIIMCTQVAEDALVLKGFDISENMASLARKKGMDVLSGQFLVIADEGPFDIILASYVLHYGLNDGEWEVLLASLTDHGALLGNFHKEIGLNQALSKLQHYKGDYKYSVIASPFGSVVAISRGSRG